MKLPLEKPLKDNIYNLMRKLGYRRQGKDSFVRPLDRSGYPRFHIYFKNNIINIHLDQKRPVYQGSTAHSGEYEGETISREAQRIRKIVNEER